MLHQNEKKYNKEKVTITLNPLLLKEVDLWSKEEKISSRSAALEKLIEEWILERQKKQVEQDTEAYYLSLSETEKEEDKNWAKLSSKQITQRYK